MYYFICVLQDVFHVIFCVFGDFYASGTQNAEVTKSLLLHYFEIFEASFYYYNHNARKSIERD